MKYKIVGIGLSMALWATGCEEKGKTDVEIKPVNPNGRKFERMGQDNGGNNAPAKAPPPVMKSERAPKNNDIK